MKHTVSAVAVELESGVVKPGDWVTVYNERYHGHEAKFRGKFPDGKLAVLMSYGSYGQTFLQLLPSEVRRLESKGAKT